MVDVDSTDATRDLQHRTADAVNRCYDRRMYRSRARQRFAGSGFHNYGFWTSQVRTQVEAWATAGVVRS